MAQDHNQHAHAWKISSTMAKTDDGGLSITFSIPKVVIDEEQNHALEAIAPTVTVQGFRKGKAPLDKVKAQVSEEKILQRALEHILPHAFSDFVSENKIIPAMYPKFEIVKAGDNEVWEITAQTCEIPKFDLGDYKEISRKAVASISLKKEEPTLEMKQQKVIEALLESIKITLPKVLTSEEVNIRLAQLLERIEKLGLNLDSYLASVGKNPDVLRKEYEAQATQAISIELILNSIAMEEKINIAKKDIDEALVASGNDESQKHFVESVLKRRAVLDQLIKTL